MIAGYVPRHPAVPGSGAARRAVKGLCSRTLPRYSLPSLNGAFQGRYTVERQLGEGGMALKVLFLGTSA